MRSILVALVSMMMGMVGSSLAIAETADDLRCVEAHPGWALERLDNGMHLGTYADEALCNRIRTAAHGGVVCAWFTPGMPIGNGSWAETGWRPRNAVSGVGLGRKVLADLDECLAVTSAANGGVVCTNTGVGAKAANIDTNMWCGASSQMQYCMEATRHAANKVVCSFPSDGSGSGNGWVRTKVTSSCDYQTGAMTLAACNATIVAP